MNTLLLAATAALAFSFSAAQAQTQEQAQVYLAIAIKPVSIDDLFAASELDCNTRKNLVCATVTPVTRSIALKDFIRMFQDMHKIHSTVEATIRRNVGWEGYITGETLLEQGKTYTFRIAGR